MRYGIRMRAMCLLLYGTFSFTLIFYFFLLFLLCCYLLLYVIIFCVLFVHSFLFYDVAFKQSKENRFTIYFFFKIQFTSTIIRFFFFSLPR